MLVQQVGEAAERGALLQQEGLELHAVPQPPLPLQQQREPPEHRRSWLVARRH